MSEFDDKPIESPEEDKFGCKAQAKTIADTISQMTAPEGTVIAINGPWGSGKSSLINLIRNHLRNATDKGDLKIVDFKCWWFNGSEALTIAYFRELYSAMKPSLTWKTKIPLKIALSKLGRYLSLVNVGIAGKILSTIGKILVQANTVESLHKKLSCALADMDSKYLIIIDDIDRLSPDDVVLIFRLVKSVGGLPNVMYLLAYDRQIAEKIFTDRYPSEGPHYLEKIVQVSFELPEPNRVSLLNEFLRRLDSVIEEREFGDGEYFRNLFDEIIAPEIKTPRDLIRILNPLQVTWPAVKGEVDPAEFLCLETLRVQRPKLYATLRANKILLTGSVMEDIGVSARMRLEQGRSSEQYNKIFLEPEPESEHERLRGGLIQLFPELERAWRNVDHPDSPADRDVRRRVCAPRHFDTYFRFSLSEVLISKREIETLIQEAGDFDYIRSSLLDAAEIKLPDGFTKATHLLYELVIHAEGIPEKSIGDLLKAIYSIADELIEKEGSNILEGTMTQLDRLTLKLLIGRLPLENRSEILRTAAEDATPGYFARIATSAYGYHFPTEGNRRKPLEECLTTEEDAVEIRDIAVKHIQVARDNDTLINCPLLDFVLYFWINVDGQESGSWISDAINDDAAIARLAAAFIGIVTKDLGNDSHDTIAGRSER